MVILLLLLRFDELDFNFFQACNFLDEMLVGISDDLKLLFQLSVLLLHFLHRLQNFLNPRFQSGIIEQQLPILQWFTLLTTFYLLLQLLDFLAQDLVFLLERIDFRFFELAQSAKGTTIVELWVLQMISVGHVGGGAALILEEGYNFAWVVIFELLIVVFGHE